MPEDVRTGSLSIILFQTIYDQGNSILGDQVRGDPKYDLIMANEVSLLHGLYAPVQPAIPAGNEGSVTYNEYSPDTRLKDFIYCYWQLKTSRPLHEPFRYRVVSDGCIDIFFELCNSEGPFVMGFSTTYTEFPIGHSFYYVGIRFLPMAFPQIFGLNISELTDRFEHLNSVTPEVARCISTVFEDLPSPKRIYPALDQFFLNLLNKTTIQTDARICNALYQILQKRGNIRVEEELDIGLSNRQLRRLFKKYVGTTPKMFSKVVRFQNIVRYAASGNNLITASFSFDPGYYDQAHFIKEFKTFYGATPAQVL